MNKFLKWFFVESNYKWLYLCVFTFLGIMIYNDEMIGILFATLILVVATLGVTKHWIDLRKMEKNKKGS